MKKICFLVFILGIVGLLQAGARNYQSQTSTVFQDNGNKVKGFAIAVGTTTPVLIYSPSNPTLNNGYDTMDRNVVIQNNSAYALYCSTYSAMSAVSGPRWIVFSSTTFSTQNASLIYCLYDSAEGSGTPSVLGRIEYDSRD